MNNYYNNYKRNQCNYGKQIKIINIIANILGLLFIGSIIGIFVSVLIPNEIILKIQIFSFFIILTISTGFLTMASIFICTLFELSSIH